MESTIAHAEGTMNLSRLDTRIATRDAGTTARGATRPWGFGNIAPGPCRTAQPTRARTPTGAAPTQDESQSRLAAKQPKLAEPHALHVPGFVQTQAPGL